MKFPGEVAAAPSDHSQFLRSIIIERTFSSNLRRGRLSDGDIRRFAETYAQGIKS
jgi:hypothetical protein